MSRSIKRLQWTWARFWRDACGNASIFFAFCAVALTGGVGIAIDTSVAYNVKSQLAAAVDAAALAGARNFSSPNRDADIQRFFDANFQAGYMGSVLEPLQIIPNNEERTVTVSARANIPTFFMSVFGTDSTDVAATAEATLSSRDVEVSLVLDITGSMSQGSRIADLKAAAKELIEIVVQDQQDPFYSKVALVPYSNAVNVGGYAEQMRGTVSPGTCTYPAEPNCESFEFRRWSDNDWTTHNISTCVTERPGPHLSTDAAPSLAPLGRHFPSASSNTCPTATIMPLSSNKTALTTAIDNLGTGGSTAGHIGVAWGWYMIAPNFAYLWPADSQPKDYGEVHLGREVLKVVVVMTDGDFNTIYRESVIARNSTGGGQSGKSKHKINLDGMNGSAFEQAQALCDNMKAEGVEVYTVGLEVAALTEATDFVNNCATDADHVYLPGSGTELKQAFRDIAAQVSNLRISM